MSCISNGGMNSQIGIPKGNVIRTKKAQTRDSQVYSKVILQYTSITSVVTSAFAIAEVVFTCKGQKRGCTLDPGACASSPISIEHPFVIHGFLSVAPMLDNESSCSHQNCALYDTVGFHQLRTSASLDCLSYQPNHNSLAFRWA